MSSGRSCGKEGLGQRAASPIQGTTKISCSRWTEQRGAVPLLLRRPQKDAALSTMTSGGETESCLPHFLSDFVTSHGNELKSNYIISSEKMLMCPRMWFHFTTYTQGQPVLSGHPKRHIWGHAVHQNISLLGCCVAPSSQWKSPKWKKIKTFRKVTKVTRLTCSSQKLYKL